MPEGEPGGPDCEVFYDFLPDSKEKVDLDDDNRFLEIGNSVFIQYVKKGEEIKELTQKNVDFGGGLTRLTAATNNDSDIFNLDIFDEAKSILEKLSKVEYLTNKGASIAYRIILDHIQAATFLIGDGVLPGNKDQQYFVRRLIRRAIMAGHKLNIKENWTKEVAETFIEYYKVAEEYLGDNLSKNRKNILEEIEKEEIKFRKTLEKGLKEFERVSARLVDLIDIDENENILEGTESKGIVITGLEAFNLYQTFGFPIELIVEIANEKGLLIDFKEFEKLKKEHAEKSRTASEGMFKGGLADHSEITTALHTASHLMLAGMKKVISKEVSQKGSNITTERLRFDFNLDRALTELEIKEIENYVNRAIQNGFRVLIEEISKEKAKAEGVTGSF